MSKRWIAIAASAIWVGLPLHVEAENGSLPLRTDSVPVYSQGTWTQKGLPTHDGIAQIARACPTPEALVNFLHSCTFKTDWELFGEEEHWQAPEEFSLRKMGDCEDYALLAQEVLTRNGIEAYVFSLFGKEGYAHTVCVFVDTKGRYNVINQDKLRYYRAVSLEAVATFLYSEWTFGGIVERAGRYGRLRYKITNSNHAALFGADEPITNFQF